MEEEKSIESYISEYVELKEAVEKNLKEIETLEQSVTDSNNAIEKAEKGKKICEEKINDPEKAREEAELTNTKFDLENVKSALENHERTLKEENDKKDNYNANIEKIRNENEANQDKLNDIYDMLLKDPKVREIIIAEYKKASAETRMAIDNKIQALKKCKEIIENDDTAKSLMDEIEKLDKRITELSAKGFSNLTDDERKEFKEKINDNSNKSKSLKEHINSLTLNDGKTKVADILKENQIEITIWNKKGILNELNGATEKLSLEYKAVEEIRNKRIDKMTPKISKESFSQKQYDEFTANHDSENVRKFLKYAVKRYKDPKYKDAQEKIDDTLTAKEAVKEEMPVTPSEPVTPDEPVTPSEPVTPDEPVTPSEPVTPDEPVTPSEPVTPITPVTPSEPVTPITPVTPSEPVTPDVPEERTNKPTSETMEKPKCEIVISREGIDIYCEDEEIHKSKKELSEEFLKYDDSETYKSYAENLAKECFGESTDNMVTYNVWPTFILKNRIGNKKLMQEASDALESGDDEVEGKIFIKAFKARMNLKNRLKARFNKIKNALSTPIGQKRLGKGSEFRNIKKELNRDKIEYNEGKLEDGREYIIYENEDNKYKCVKCYLDDTMVSFYEDGYYFYNGEYEVDIMQEEESLKVKYRNLADDDNYNEDESEEILPKPIPEDIREKIEKDTLIPEEIKTLYEEFMKSKESGEKPEESFADRISVKPTEIANDPKGYVAKEGIEFTKENSDDDAR